MSQDIRMNGSSALGAAFGGRNALQQAGYKQRMGELAQAFVQAQQGRKYQTEADLAGDTLTARGQLGDYFDPGAAVAARAASSASPEQIINADLRRRAADSSDPVMANQILAAVSGKPRDLIDIKGDTAYNPTATPDQQSLSPTQVGMADIAAKMANAYQSKAAAENSFAGAHLRDVQAAAGGFNPRAGGDSSVPVVAANPNGAHGGDYLASIDPTQATQVKALAEGRMAFPTGTALKSPYWQQMLQHVAQYDPSFDAVNYNARAGTRKDFTSGKSAQTVNALNTVAEHLGTLSDYTGDLNNTQIPTINRVKNWLAAQTGDPDVAKFNTAKKAVADEVAKVWRSTGGSQMDIEENLRNLDGAQSPAQLNAAIGTLTKLIAGKVAALQDQYRAGMGTTQDLRPLVSPEAKHAFDKTTERSGLSPTDFGAISDMGPGSSPIPDQSTAPAQAMPRAINPTTGHAVVWNGSAWVSEQ